jgi:hypothetical protein
LITNTNQARVAYNSKVDGRGGMYNFDMKKWNTVKNTLRNVLTIGGNIVNSFTNILPGGPLIYGGSTPYPIYYSGTVTINH